MNSINRRKRGEEGENIAAEYLCNNGMKILERNYRFNRGEVDIIAEDGEEIIFVEVKMRISNTFGTPEEAVTEEKQRQIMSVAEGYLYERNLNNRPCRFDVVAIDFLDGKKTIRHERDAFSNI
jgi:putative endonuclease